MRIPCVFALFTRLIPAANSGASRPLTLTSLANLDWLKALGYDTSVSPVRLSFLAHETGRLQGQYEIGLDLDVETLRALGEFFVTLADRADSSPAS